NPGQGYGGGADGFLSMISPGGAIVVYSTFLGGSGDDAILSVAVDAAGNAYVAGATYSTNLSVSLGASGVNHGGADAFVAKIAAVMPASWWTAYLADSNHSGLNPNQQMLNRGTASRLRQLFD